MAPLAYEERGTGTPVVLVHAFPLSRAMWRGELDRIGASAWVIAPDLPGFGESRRMPQPSIAGMAAAVIELLDWLKVREPAIVAGLSMGGYVAFEIIRQAPARVKALGLFSTRAAPDSPEQRAGRMKLIERLRRDGIKVLDEASLPKLVGATTHASRPQVVERVKALMRQASVEGVADALSAMASRRDSTQLLSSIACPTLIVAGAEDALIPPAESESMARAIPGVRLDVIPQAGHLVNLEQPSRFQSAVADWITPLVTG